MAASGNHDRNGTVTPCILPIDSMQYECVYFLDCTFTYLNITTCEIFDLIDCFRMVVSFLVFTHGFSGIRYAFIYDKLRLLQCKRISLYTVAFVSIFNC